MEYEKKCKVYCCCGKYIVPTEAVTNAGKKIYCPSCNKKLTVPVTVPKIIVVHN